MTDSGRIQEETTSLGIPCLTLRNNTERPITVTHGTNILVGQSEKKILREIHKILIGKEKKGNAPVCWDGKTAQRICLILKEISFEK
jgi:UDP-N-acetylglucosamine 2-epimerase (non-hydrolysing)